jgi:hypothetical protein
MDDVSRKRRQLEREKRVLDAPRPARRYQLFQTELVRNPDWRAPSPPANAAAGGSSRRKRRAAEAAPEEPEREIGAYVAFPDLRGLEEQEAWLDMEHMGVSSPQSLADEARTDAQSTAQIRPDLRLGMHGYRGEELAPPPGLYGAQAGASGMYEGSAPGAYLPPGYDGPHAGELYAHEYAQLRQHELLMQQQQQQQQQHLEQLAQQHARYAEHPASYGAAAMPPQGEMPQAAYAAPMPPSKSSAVGAKAPNAAPPKGARVPAPPTAAGAQAPARPAGGTVKNKPPPPPPPSHAAPQRPSVPPLPAAR